jgi:dTDP-N-acetylfucosamine:lipid II N-acetylfucosaminyltransferase
MSRILHIITFDKFIPAFVEFIDTHFDASEHEYFIFGTADANSVGKTKSKISFQSNFLRHPLGIVTLTRLIRRMNSAEKIIIHGLWNERVVQILWAMPWLLPKSYWVIWGADLYNFSPNATSRDRLAPSAFRKYVTKSIGHLVTYIEGDANLAKAWFHAKGQVHDCLVYPSNTFKASQLQKTRSGKVRILAGNSGCPANNHLDIFSALKRLQDQDFEIVCPLSYGDATYAREVETVGKTIFGKRFVPIKTFLPREEYSLILSNVDIAVFAHDRQQGMGNLISLLGFGATVFMKSNVTTWQFLESLRIHVFDLNCSSIDQRLTEAEATSNRRIISSFFSAENLRRGLDDLFRD